MRKYWLIIGLIVSIGLSGLVSASAYAESEPAIPSAPSLASPVIDQTGTLSDGQIRSLAETISSTRTKKDYQLGILMISSLNGYPLEQYSIDVARKWGIGEKSKNNGIFLIIAKDDHLLRIEVGSGLEGDLTDIQSSHIINGVITPQFKKDDFYMGIHNGIESIAALVQGEADPHAESAGVADVIFTILPIGIVIIMWMSSILARSKSWWAGGVVGGVGGLGVALFSSWVWWSIGLTGLLIVGGLFLDRAVSRDYLKHKKSGDFTSSWWSGGSWWGGGGGSSGSGGGGGFGGGGFSGGGSSGSW